MKEIVVTPATAQDVADATLALYGQSQIPPVRIRALAAKIDGKVVGIGGIAFMPNGTRVAFCDIANEVRDYKMALHKAGLATIKLADELGIRRLVATTITGVPAAPRWLERLGFCKDNIDGVDVYVRHKPIA